MTGESAAAAAAGNNHHHLQNEFRHEIRHKVLPAFCKALVAWVFLFVVVIPHLFVAWSWNAPSSVDQDINVTLPQQHEQQQQPQLLDSNKTSGLLELPIATITTTTTNETAVVGTNVSTSTGPDNDFDGLEEEDEEGDDVDEDQKEEEEEEEEEEEVGEEVVEIQVINETKPVEKVERQQRVIEEVIILVKLPDPYEEVQDEIDYSLEDLQASLDELRGGIFQPLQNRMNVIEDSLRRLLDKPTAIAPIPKTTVHLESLQRLLSLESLSDLSDEELQYLFATAREESLAVAANNVTVPWNQVEAILNKSYPRSNNTANFANNKTNVTSDGCPKLVLSDLNQSLARDTDLARQRQDVQRLLDTLSQDLLDNSLLRTRQRRWEQSVAQLALQAKQERDLVLAQEIETRNRGQNCITQEQVTEMVEEGLVALQHDVNSLRTVLERKTKALEPEAQVILDAIFLPSKQQRQERRRPLSWLSSTLTTSQSINLRQLLDTPLVSQQVPLWLDALEKMVGGHLDVVDDFLDWLVQQPPPTSIASTTTQTGISKMSVGHLIVAHLLEVAGNVNVTIPDIVRELPRKHAKQR